MGETKLIMPYGLSANKRYLEWAGAARRYADHIALHDWVNIRLKTQEMEGSYRVLPTAHLEWPWICRCKKEFPWGHCRGDCKLEYPTWVEAAMKHGVRFEIPNPRPL
jgi:hypothetical protein